MGVITLVRHGQANSAATDEAGYDRLSELGHQQARWLGDWMRDQGETFDLVLSGSLQRHKETASAMGWQAPEIDARLNELDYFNLGKALQDAHGIPPASPENFVDHFIEVLHAWQRAEICGNETFESFESRVSGILQEAAQPGKQVLCITSGGVIAMIIRHLLDLDLTRMAHVSLPILNTSIHRIHVRPVGTILAGYNAVPHLDRADRSHAQTHY